MTFPVYIQKALDLGLLVEEDGKIVDCKKDEVETVMGMARLIEKMQPEDMSEQIDTTDQEAIVLCRVIGSDSNKAYELWGELRIAFGVGHGQSIPDDLWTNGTLRAIGREIDRTFIGDRNTTSISNKGIILSYSQLDQSSQDIDTIEFNKAVIQLADKNRMDDYGDKKSEWKVALDLLRDQRVRAIYNNTQLVSRQAAKAKSKLLEQIQFQQEKLMMCLGMLNGNVGNQGNAIDIVEQLVTPETKEKSIINRMLNTRASDPPISVGIPALDIDMQGGIRKPGQEQGGRIFVLGARTGIGKSILGVHTSIHLAMKGLVCGFISAEMDEAEISSRIWSAATKHMPNGQWVSVSSINDPTDKKDKDAKKIFNSAKMLRDSGGKLLLDSPWGADVDAVANSLRSMKSKNPTMRACVIDHFHCLGRHRNAPTNESAMLEERAYRLVSVAKELSIDLLILAQLNRTGMGNESDPKVEPDETWIRGTDALSHIAHAVWIARREKPADDNQDKTKRNIEIWHAKQRGSQCLYFDGVKKVPNSFVKKSTLWMDYAYSSIKDDDTIGQVW
jgi:replicative DNA helicase